MTLLREPPDVTPPAPRVDPAADPQALFKEARRRRRRRWVLASGALALLVTVLCAGALISGGAGTGSGSSASPGDAGARPSVAAAPPRSFVAVGTGLLTNSLDCVTESTCFAVVDPQPGDALHDGFTFPGVLLAKTTDGGATWRRLRSVPRRWSPQQVIACPTAQMCALAVQPAAPHNNLLPAHAIAVTHDGGADWNVEQLPLPGTGSEGTVEHIACADGAHCLAYVAGQGRTLAQPGTFFATSDGGATWTEDSTIELPPARSVVALRCDPGGRCIVLLDGRPGGVTLASDDFGASWTEGSPSPFPSSALMHASCGDASHCLYATDSGGLAYTDDGGVSWGRSNVAVPDGQIVTAVDCANGTNCSAAASRWASGNYVDPIVYRSEDGARTWGRVKVPARADGARVATVVPLSCPSSRGCIGIAQTTSSSFHQGTKRVVVSGF